MSENPVKLSFRAPALMEPLSIAPAPYLVHGSSSNWCAFIGLPKELIEVVALALPTESRKAIRSCCKALRGVVDNTVNYVDLEPPFPQEGLTSSWTIGQLLEALLSRFNSAHSVKFQPSLVPAPMAASLLSIPTQLTALQLSLCAEDSATFESLANNSTLSKLTSLTILSLASATGTLGLQPLARCKKLQSLTLDFNLHSQAAAGTESEQWLAVLADLPRLSNLVLCSKSNHHDGTSVIPSAATSLTHLSLPSLPHVTHLTIPCTSNLLASLSHCPCLSALQLLPLQPPPLQPPPPSSTTTWPPDLTLSTLKQLQAPINLVHPANRPLTPQLETLSLQLNNSGANTKDELLHIMPVATLSLNTDVLSNRILYYILRAQNIPCALKHLSLHFTKAQDPRSLALLTRLGALQSLHIHLDAPTCFSPQCGKVVDVAHFRFVQSAFADWEFYKEDLLKHYSDDLLLSALAAVRQAKPRLQVTLQSATHSFDVDSTSGDGMMRQLIADSLPRLEAGMNATHGA